MGHTEIRLYKCNTCGRQVFQDDIGRFECSCGSMKIGYLAPGFYAIIKWMLHHPRMAANLIWKEGMCLK